MKEIKVFIAGSKSLTIARDAIRSVLQILSNNNAKKVLKKFMKFLITSEDVAVKQFLQSTIKEIIINHDDIEIKYVT